MRIMNELLDAGVRLRRVPVFKSKRRVGSPGKGFCRALAHIKMPGWDLQGDERRKARNKRRRIRQGRAA